MVKSSRIREKRVCIADFKGHKTWDKHERTKYDSERQAAFLKSAQKFVLSKGNKLLKGVQHGYRQ